MRCILSQKKYIARLKSPDIIPTQKLPTPLHDDGQLPLWMLVQLIVKMWPPILLMPDKFPLGLGDLKGKKFPPLKLV